MMQNVNDIDRKIIMDAKYHDMSRQNDYDDFHGYVGVIKLIILLVIKQYIKM